MEQSTETTRLLAVNHDFSALRPLQAMAESNSWQLDTVASSWEALERVQSGIAPHILIINVARGDRNSLYILQWLHKLRPEMKTILLCHSADAELKKDAIRMGANDVLVRPFKEEHLELAIYRYLARTNSGHCEIPQEDTDTIGVEKLLVAGSPLTQQLRAEVELLGQADVPVLITGEKGSGKTIIAELIHRISTRAGAKLWKINAAHARREILEAEFSALFSPIGADAAKKSTVVFEELSELSDHLQGKLLEVLQQRPLKRSGNGSGLTEGVRILATSSVNIERALAEKKLREDLYYRLSAFTVHVPALRQRKQEIPALLNHFMRNLASHYGLSKREFSSQTIESCLSYWWPGNLVELRAFVKRYLTTGNAEIVINELHPANGATHSNSPVTGFGKLLTGTFPSDASQGKPQSLKLLVQNIKREAERNAIGVALEKTGWNRKAAAQMLQISYRALLYKIDEYHMTSSESFASALPTEQLSVAAKTK